ncbi:MAG: SEC-C domain-containing protein [Leptospiraceae bacterium]|nr:SEC-C domain-containing protein [Leptospiraceae bacterium]
MPTNKDLFSLYPEYIQTAAKFDAQRDLGLATFLNCLHYTWDDHLRSDALIEPIKPFFEKSKDLTTIRPLFEIHQNYSNACIHWLGELEELEDEDADEHIEKALCFFSKQLGKNANDDLFSGIKTELLKLLAEAGVDLPTEGTLDDQAIARIRKSRLEPACEVIASLVFSTYKTEAEKEDEEEVLDRIEDMFFDYAIACRYLDEYRRETFFFEQEFKDIGRNHPCPCQSGRKWKQCHGRYGR